MIQTAGETEPGYRWYILTLGVATHIFVAALPMVCMPVLFPEIAADLNLDLVQIGLIWGIANLPGMLASIFGGMLGDKYGTASVLAVFCLATGLTCGLRGTAQGFPDLIAYTILFGLAQIPLAITVHKAAGQWFSRRQLGMANGILALGMGTGGILAAMISATVVSPLLDGWRNVMFAYAAITVLFAFLWLQTRHRRPPRTGQENYPVSVDFRQSIRHVIRLRSVWIIAVTQIFVSVLRNGVVGYLPTYLDGIGWSTAEASGALSALSAASAIGVIPLSILSDRLGLRKVILIPAYLVTCLSVVLLSVNNSAVIWPMVIIIGLCQEGIAAVTITLTMETEGVGTTYAGTALGLTSTASKLGGVVGPPLGNRMAAIKPAFGFVFWAVSGAVATLMFFFVKETGSRRRQSVREIQVN